MLRDLTHRVLVRALGYLQAFAHEIGHVGEAIAVLRVALLVKPRALVEHDGARHGDEIGQHRSDGDRCRRHAGRSQRTPELVLSPLRPVNSTR